MTLSILKNLHKVVKQVRAFADSKVVCLEESELQGYLSLLQEHNVEIPWGLQKDLLERTCRQLQNSGNYKQLLEVLNPYAAQEKFDGHHPTLRAISTDQPNKVATFFG